MDAEFSEPEFQARKAALLEECQSEPKPEMPEATDSLKPATAPPAPAAKEPLPNRSPSPIKPSLAACQMLRC